MILELCTASVDDCITAQAGGADRVELNAGLMLGGLTPSLGTVQIASAVISLPIISMIRPRPGGFCYSSSDFFVMERDAELMEAHGAQGIAFGILTEEGHVDEVRCRTLIDHCGELGIVFHRAFDVVPDPFQAIDLLVDLGVNRIMTSGQEASAYNGAENIARFIDYAAGRIEILPAGGINRFTLADVLARTGCTQVHASLSRKSTDRSTQSRPQVAFGGGLKMPETRFTTTDPQAVNQMRCLLDAV
jgi:copper homeostasis protein